MRNALTIAAREFEEKRFVAYAAVAFAILPFILGVIPGISGKSPQETIALSSLIFATTFAVALGVMTGASFVGRDLSDGRMSFYFARPVASSSIWFGKLTAGILMIVGCFAVIIAPAWLAGGSSWKGFSTIDLGNMSVMILTTALALFLIAHVIGTFARSRSPWIAGDFAAAVVCGVVIRFCIQPLAAGQALDLISKLSIWLSIALAVAIIAGGAWQLERGRTDRRRNHLALSQFLWATVGVVLLITAGFVAWVVSVKPSDLTSKMHMSRSTSGPFAVITGETRWRDDYRAGFLINTDDGSVTHVDSRADWAVRYTRDGRSVMLPRLDISAHTADLLIYRKDLKEPIDTGLSLSAGDFFVSDDGGRIATISRSNILSVYDVAQKRSLVSVRLPDSRYTRAFFVTADLVRLYLNAEEATKIMELDVRSRDLRQTGIIESKTFVQFYPDASATHMLVKAQHADVLTLNDARTGALITTLVSGTNIRTARYLRDGRIAIVDGPPSASVLHILSAGGVAQRDIPLGPIQWMTVVGDDGTRVVLAADISPSHRELLAVDMNRGLIERRVAIMDWVPSGTFDPRPPIEPLREVFYGDSSDHKNYVVAWNPATGAKRRVT